MSDTVTLAVAQYTATEMVLIITAIFGGLATTISAVISAIKSNQASNTSTENARKLNEAKISRTINSSKLDVIHQSTNGNLGEMKVQLAEMSARLEVVTARADRLDDLVLRLSSIAPQGSLKLAQDAQDSSELERKE